MNGEANGVDVAIIGGGAIGMACARELALRGTSVAVLERDRVGRACSYGNAGWLTPSLAMPLAAPGQVRQGLRWMFDPLSPFHVPFRPDPALWSWLFRFIVASRKAPFVRGAAALVELCHWSVDAWEELAREGPESFGYARAGLLAVYETPKIFDKARAATQLTTELGVPYEEWTSEQVREREPAIRGPQIGALHFPRDAHCEPYPAVHALAAAAKRAGAVIHEDTEVLDAEGDETIRTLHTTKGSFFAKDVVLAAGTWSGSLGKRLGLRLPILGAKGYSLVLPPLDPHPTRSIYLAERKVALNPHAGALRLSGTLDLVGEDLSVNRRRVDAIVQGARKLVNLPEPVRELELWRGLRPCLPDGMPMIGRARRFRNLWLATGHQMTGLKTAPGTGRLLAELMAGETPSFDPAPFRADR